MAYKNPEDKIKYDIWYRENNPEQVMLSSAKNRAKSKGLEFDITLEDIIIPEFCPITGLRLERNLGASGPRPSSPTLDRIDNSKGYIKGNVSVISGRANKHKSDLSIEEIESLWRYVNER